MFSTHPPLRFGAVLRNLCSQIFAPVREWKSLTGASLLHQIVKNKGNHDASHDLRGNGCEKLPHGRTLLSEACPTAVLPEKAAAFKKKPPPLRRAGDFSVSRLRAAALSAASRGLDAPAGQGYS